MAMRLEDIELIQQLKHRYFRALDRADWDLMRTVLAEDATTAYIGDTYRHELQGCENIIAFLSQTMNPNGVACHIGHHPEILVLSDTEAEGKWYLTDMYIDFRDDTILRGSAIYSDRYRKINGAWRVQHTGYTRIYEQVEPLPEHFNLTTHYLAGAQPPITTAR
jgi:hypothetical protein